MKTKEEVMQDDLSIVTPKPRDPRALNSYRHGLTGHVLVIPSAEQKAYQNHCQGIYQALAPADAMQTSLVQSIADDRWRLMRAAAIESNIFALGLDAPDEAAAPRDEVDTALAMARVWLENGKQLQLLALYESRLQRHVEKNMALLRQLQEDRRTALAEAAEEATLLTRLTAATGEDYAIPPEARAAQFAFSPVQIARLAQHNFCLAQARRLPRPPHPIQSIKSEARA